MRLISENLQKDFAYTFAAGFKAEEAIDFALDNDEAVIVRDVSLTFDTGSAAPSFTAAGIAAFLVAMAGKSQATPSNLASLDRLQFLAGQSNAMTAAGPIFLYPEYIMRLERFKLTQTLVMHSYTTNVTNAATTILRVKIFYDRYSITSAEKVLLL